MLDVTAYCDESATDQEVYTIAGYWATAVDWHKFEHLWNLALAAEHLTEFHAKECQHCNGEFADKTAAERRRIWRKFIGILTLNSIAINGFFAVMDLRGWSAVAGRAAELRARAGLGHVYYVLFQTAVEMVAKGMEVFPEGEFVSLVFDDRPDHGKVMGLFESLKTAPEADLAFVSRRLGNVTQGDSKHLPQLQAADVLAYEVREQFAGVEYGIDPRHSRWQWKRLFNPVRVKGEHFPSSKIPELLTIMERRFGTEAEEIKLAKERDRAERAARGAKHRAAAGITSPDDADKR